MLNLSDKELDRFSKEAAEEYDPGDVLGPRSWDKLELRINQEFGRPGWNPLQHFRRFAFYYAPALLALVGITYYMVRPGASSGSSPGRTAKAPTEKTSVQTQNPFSTDKTTSTPATSSSATASTADSGQDAVRQPGQSDGANASTDRPSGAPNAVGAANGGATTTTPATTGAARSAAGKTAANTGNTHVGTAATGLTNAGAAAHSVGARNNRRTRNVAGISNSTTTRNRRRGRTKNGKDDKNTAGAAANTAGAAAGQFTNPGSAGQSANASPTSQPGATSKPRATSQPRELTLSSIQSPHDLKKKAIINDSALRAFTLKSTVPGLIKPNKSLHINRKWEFGVMVAPDFTSVNSLAGDKPGSSFGLTVDYNFAPRWYIGTGILATRKNYSARSEDYHATQSLYNLYGVNPNSVNYVKGSFYMMEVPLNLRYDFTVAGSTLFFASGGVSSYLFTTENTCAFGTTTFFRPFSQTFQPPPPAASNYLCSTVNLSVGVEAGISNSLSILVAPYMKIPTRGIGAGQVQMNSVGINFSLKWAPVTSRRRY